MFLTSLSTSIMQLRCRVVTSSRRRWLSVRRFMTEPCLSVLMRHSTISDPITLLVARPMFGIAPKKPWLFISLLKRISMRSLKRLSTGLWDGPQASWGFTLTAMIRGVGKAYLTNNGLRICRLKKYWPATIPTAIHWFFRRGKKISWKRKESNL